MQLAGQKRDYFGKKTKYLKAERKIPAVVFGKNMESLPITIDQIDFIKTFESAGETSIIDLTVGKENIPVLVKDVQLHHIDSKPIHVGFYKVNLKEKINAQIPVEVINEEENELIRKKEALVLVLLNEIEVEALPGDLPEKFIVDATKLPDMDAVLTIAELDYDKEKIEITGAEEEEIVAKLDYAQMLEEEEEEELTEEEVMAALEATEEKDDEEEGEEGQEAKEKPQPEESSEE